MTVNRDKLIRMAEQITANMAYTEDESVVAGNVANHLNRFWDPRMRAAILAAAKDDPDQLSSTLRRALNQLA